MNGRRFECDREHQDTGNCTNNFHKSLQQVYLLVPQKGEAISRPSWEGRSPMHRRDCISPLEQHWEMRSLRLASPESMRVWTRAGSYTAAYKQSLEAPSHGSPARSHISHFRRGRDDNHSSASALLPISTRPYWPETGPPHYWQLLAHFQLDGNAWMAFYGSELTVSDPCSSPQQIPWYTGVQSKMMLQVSLSHKQTINFKAFLRKCDGHISWEFPSKAKTKEESLKMREGIRRYLLACQQISKK